MTPLATDIPPGYLDFYDERHRPTFPLISQAIYEHLQAIWNESKRPALCKAGRIIGWIEALCENSSQTFRSLTSEECLTVLQEV